MSQPPTGICAECFHLKPIHCSFLITAKGITKLVCYDCWKSFGYEFFFNEHHPCGSQPKYVMKCILCHTNPAAIPDRNRPGRPKRICRECHSKRLSEDARSIPRSNHLCITCFRDCNCPGLHMLTDCSGCRQCQREETGL